MLRELLPETPEAWAFTTLVFTTLAAGVGWIVKWWADRKIATANAAALATSEANKSLADLQKRIIDGAERREAEANKRMDAALAGMAQLTIVTNELTAVNKVTHEEVRRVNSNCDLLIRSAATLETLLRDRR